MSALATTEAVAADRRRHPRVGVMWMSTLQVQRAFYDCIVIDLSRGGAKLVFAEPHDFAPGTSVALVIERFGTFRAETVWRRASLAGIRFLDPPETIAAAFRDVLPP